MKTSSRILVLLFLSTAGVTMAQPTAFAYQGRLSDNGTPATGIYDLRFMIFDAPGSGAARWLDIAVRPGTSTGTFSTLSPRQPFTSAPYAIRAASLTGTLPLSQLPAGVVTNNGSVVTLSGSFTGNGASLSNVNAATLGGLSNSNLWKVNGNAAFGLGADDKSIATVDADGVALAAIQGLNQKLAEELTRRDAENTELKRRLAALEEAILNKH